MHYRLGGSIARKPNPAHARFRAPPPLPRGLKHLTLKATVVSCPVSLIGQWQDEIKAFMATAPTACKFLLTKVKDCEVFINEDFDDKGAICLREWAEQGNVYYYIEPGLERVRC